MNARSTAQSLTIDDLNAIEAIMLAEARENFWAFRQVYDPQMIKGWWVKEVSYKLQEFYEKLVAGERPMLLLEAAPQHGKAVYNGTFLLTTKGWMRHGDLRLGDRVFHPSGRTTKVVHLHREHKDIDHEVTFSNGERVVVHANHEWTVHNSRNRGKLETIETWRMVGRTQYDNGGVHASRYMLPHVQPLHGVRKHLALDPYALGLWLGDGTYNNPVITLGPKKLPALEKLKVRGLVPTSSKPNITNCTAYYFGRPLTTPLRELGLFGVREKRIPEQYLVAPLDDRLELLAGLIDSDGYIYAKNGRVTFSNTNKALIDDVVSLLATFGWRASVCRFDPIDGFIGECWQVGFNPTFAIPTARCKQKKITSTHRRVAIVDVRVLDKPKWGRCITVDAPDGLYLIGKTLQPTHNSRMVQDFIGWVAGRSPNIRTIFTSFSDDLGTRTNRYLQRMYDSDIYHRTFPGTRIGGRNAVTVSNRWLRNSYFIEYVGHRGSFRNTTVEGAITGQSLDFGVIDDPIKGAEAARSKVQRDKVWDWFLEEFFSRFDEKAGMLMTMTRWHLDDPGGRFLSAFPNVIHLRYPAFAEKDEPHRKIGEPLFPEFKSKEFLEIRKKSYTSAAWAALYQQNPFIVGGGLFPVDKFKIMQEPIDYKRDVKRAVRAFDKAGTEGGGAYTAGVLMFLLNDGRLLIEDVRRKQLSFHEREQMILNTAIQDRDMYGRNVRIWIEQEPGSGGKESAERTIAMLKGFVARADKVTGSKETRAEPFAAQVQGGNVYLRNANWNGSFIDEAEAFPNGKYKDQIDAAAMAFMKLTDRTALYDGSLRWVG